MAVRKLAKDSKKSIAVPVSQIQLGVVTPVALEDIELSYENQRTGNWAKGDTNNYLEGSSFESLIDSLKEVGQTEPGTGRIKGKKVQLIKGFRRYAALRQIAGDRPGALKGATMLLIVKDLDDMQAFEEHVTENTARDNLKGSDLAFAAYKMKTMHADRGRSFSGNEIAKRLGKNQSYISMLLRIIEGGPAIAAEWRKSELQLSINEMVRVTKEKDPAKQEKLYNQLLTEKEPDPDGNKWLKSAIDKAARQGTFLGNLERLGCITVEMAWEEHLGDLGVSLKEDATTAQTNKVAQAARNAYAAAKEAQPEVKEEKKATNGKGKKAKASDNATTE